MDAETGKEWRGYEAEKTKARRLNLSAEEFEAYMAQVINRLKL